MTTLHRFLTGLLCTLAVIATGCADGAQDDASAATAAEPTTDQADTAETDEAGTDEVSGTLDFYTSQPDADYEALVEAFTAQHPDVEVNVFRSGTEEVVSRILAEDEAGGVQADVLLIADELNLLNLKERGLLAAYESPQLAGIPEEFVDDDLTFAGTKVIDTAIAINTDLVDTPPTSWTDLLGNPGQVTMASPQYSGAAAYNVGVVGRDDQLGWDFWETLAEEDATVVQGNGAVLEAVAEGRSAYGIVVSFIVARAAEQGSPVQVVYPEEGVLAITEPVGITQAADNRPAAEAFVDFVLSQEGQELAASLGYTPLRDGVGAPAGLPTVEELSLIEPADLAELLAAQEEDVERFVGLFGEL